MKDTNAEVKFNLGDLSIFGEESKLKNEPEYGLTLKMSKDSAKAFEALKQLLEDLDYES